MLDRSKLLQELNKFSGSLFADHSKEFAVAKNIWSTITQDLDFKQRIDSGDLPMLLPTWQESLSNIYDIASSSHYCVISCDGSQIYPDRHQGTSCSLINIGTVKINYGEESKVQLENFPFLFAQEEDNSVEIVDCKRQEFEFQYGLALMQSDLSQNKLFLFDGSLIFWHLESKSAALGQEYLGKYLGLLHQFYKSNSLIAGYISLPKSKELVNLIRAQLYFDNNDFKIENVLDFHIASFFLNKFQRTILFKNCSPVTKHYPEHLHPYFFYLDVGDEIVRVEIPFWIAQSEEKVDLIAQIIVDQCKKGYGFPVCLAEAHEQAVVKSSDREFFYHVLNKSNVQNRKQVLMSQKSIKKKFMGI